MAGTEYADISDEEQDHASECPVYDAKLSSGEVLVLGNEYL